ncbi:hypothetical protein P153DRAFT_383665 [Dothidotthia symphoricarpi CBS 119687]|uniref:Rpr2-domain-containing protein n=1 Tax=Dothidotthia symphoricarpi CBS 119687 TaxID=1392245 RepID=A0A6A6AM68_9PLEO|nr:uncharacterized protein P153DRAFT_383665 [Dothidotthia symphoricarpi CBS 119687]KAF2131571.1 hypothetical protein P153DRAFT_383665 [Dothidotthia symphoricarpi CBS 119687]
MTSMDSVGLRSKFLQEAAHLLAVSSPAASAFLGSARDRLFEDTEQGIPAKDWDALRRETCGACGNRMIPGWSCKITTRTLSGVVVKKKPAIPNKSTRPEKNIVLDCLRCRRKTIQSLQPRPSRHIRKSKSRVEAKSTLDLVQPTKEEENKVLKSANANSKQRKKARKGGLQAMLEKNKTNSSQGGLGLDLMDFAM